MTEKITRKPFKKLVTLDFDGVLHAYTTPWRDAGTISDGPTPGALEFLWTISSDSRCEVVVCSSRCREDIGRQAIEQWLIRQMGEAFGDEGRYLAFDIPVVAEKPPAFVTIDDRAIKFIGQWPSLDRLAAVQPWNKKPLHLRQDPETAVVVADALMMKIARLAKETGCPEDTPPFEWITEMAEMGHKAATMAPVTIERISDDDLTRIMATPVRQATPVAEAETLERICSLGDAAKILGRDRGTLRAWIDRGAPVHVREGPSFQIDLAEFLKWPEDEVRALEAAKYARPTVNGVPVISADELPAPDEENNEIRLDRTRFRIRTLWGRFDIEFGGDLGREVSARDWMPEATAILERLHALPIPTSSLDPAIDAYLDALDGVDVTVMLTSEIDDERIVKKHPRMMSCDRRAVDASIARRKVTP